MQPDRLVVRPAGPGDGIAAAELLLEIPGGLVEMLGDRAAARPVARAAFRSRRSVLGFDRAMVADEGGRVVGLMVAVPGGEWARRRVPTGMAMLRGAGPRHAWRVFRRGRLEEMLVPPVPLDALHVVALSVAPDRRGNGIGSQLLNDAARQAEEGRFARVTLDVGGRSVGAIRLYERRGFVPVSSHERPARRGLPAASSVRMERVVGGMDSGAR
jgi:ribosomal protein S18 acetylase RimI-like enzyme